MARRQGNRCDIAMHAPHQVRWMRSTYAPLAHRLQRLEALGRTRGMNIDFRIGVFHGDEDISPAFRDGDRLRLFPTFH